MKPTPLQRYNRLRARHRTKGGRNALPAKLEWIRAQPCAVCGVWPVEAHHETGGGGPADDRITMPLCFAHHKVEGGPAARHAMKAHVFAERFFGGRPLVEVCGDYHEQWLREAA